jgi:hypothetical protein
MSSQYVRPLPPRDPKRDPTMLSILRWLVADVTRTLPPPDDDARIADLAQAIRRTTDYTRSLMAWSYGDRPGSDTHKIL